MKPHFAFALILFIALRLAAQDVIISGPSWIDPHDAPDQLPVVKIPTPDYPQRLIGSTEIGYMVVDSFIYAQHKGSLRQNASSDSLFFDALHRANADEWQPGSDEWWVKPAMRDGKPVNSLVRCTFIFNPACASKGKPDATPRLLGVVVPELPKKIPPSKIYVTASVDASGRVTKAVAAAGAPEALGPLAESAVLKWSFAPARKNDQPVAQDVRVPVVFLNSYNNNNADAAVYTPARVIHREEAEYPPTMRDQGLRGEVKVDFVVDIEGRVRDPVVISSTNPGFDQAAIDAVLKSSFGPALRHGVPVNEPMSWTINFQIRSERNGSRGNDLYQITGDFVDQGKLPPELRYDVPPKPANTVFAVYPFELLRDHVRGAAAVGFLVSPDGSVAATKVIEAERPEFGQALVAMLDEWKFQPAMKDGKPTWTALKVRQEFSEYGNDVPVSDETLHLLHELKKEKPALCPIKDLDAAPQLLSRRAPVFPSSLIGTVAVGQAVVEFLIDHDGNVQLPRIVSATDPAFGYAAVQGVSAWKFAPLTSHGQSVNVRAQIPLKFIAPKSTATAPPSAQN